MVLIVADAEPLLDNTSQFGRRPPVTFKTRGERAFVVNVAEFGELIES